VTAQPAPLDIRAAEEILRANFAPWVLALDLSIRETTANSATLAMPSNPKLHRTGGIVSGQALMALADTAMVIALSAAGGEFRPFATVDVHTTFLRPATDSGVLALATVLRMGRTMGFAEVRVVTDTAERHLLAHVTGSYAIPQQR
jgi:uncharacterized protein (TIGR00369 family)